MKIVVNKCYGGFSLSPKAVKRLAELNGKECYFFTNDRSSGAVNLHKHVPAKMEDIGDGLFWSAYSVPNPDEVALSQERWFEMTPEEKDTSNKSWAAIDLTSSPTNRTDPLLVQVVEELGAEANGRYAKLTIVDIPDDVEWELDEYDGIETVREKHRSW